VSELYEAACQVNVPVREIDIASDTVAGSRPYSSLVERRRALTGSVLPWPLTTVAARSRTGRFVATLHGTLSGEPRDEPSDRGEIASEGMDRGGAVARGKTAATTALAC